MGLSGQSNDACTKVLTAGAKQSGFERMANTYEFKQSKELEKEAYEWFGNDAIKVMGTAAWASRAISERKVSVGLPNLGICDRMSFELGSSASKLVFDWKF